MSLIKLLLLSMIKLSSCLSAIEKKSLDLDGDATLVTKVEMVNGFIDNFKYRSVLIHYDAENKPFTDTLIYLRYCKMSKLENIITYQWGGESLNSENKVDGKAYIHVVVTKDPTVTQQFYDQYTNLKSIDTVLFVLYDPLLTEFYGSLWVSLNLENAGNVFVYDVTNAQSPKLSRLCIFCTVPYPEIDVVQPIAVMNGTDTYDPTLFVPQNFTNMRGHRFNVGIKEFMPFCWCKKDRPMAYKGRIVRKCLDVRGVEGRLVEVMGKKLNFTYNLIGDPQKTFGGFVNDVIRKDVDWVAGGFTITDERMKFVTFSRPFRLVAWNFLYLCRQTVWDSLSSVSQPFDMNVWLTFLFVIPITGFVLWLVVKTDSKITARENIGLLSCMESCSVPLIEQPSLYTDKIAECNAKRLQLAPRLVVLSWLLVVLNVVTAYKSKLSSLLVNPPHTEPDTLIQLLEHRYNFIVTVDNAEIVWKLLSMETETNPNVEEVKRKTSIINTLCEAFDIVLQGDSALFSEDVFMEYVMRSQCGAKLKNAQYELRLGTNGMLAMFHAWPMRQGAAYERSFNKLIGYIFASGIMQKWTYDDAEAMRLTFDIIPRSKNNTQENRKTTLSFQTITSPLIIYVCGIISGVVCFAFEWQLSESKVANKIASLF